MAESMDADDRTPVEDLIDKLAVGTRRNLSACKQGYKLIHLVEAKLTAKQRVVKISVVVDKVCQRAYEDGLDHASLDKLVDIITLPNRMEQASQATLIRNLYPEGKIEDSIVIKVVGSLGHGRDKPPLNVQGILLKWLAMVYDVLVNPKSTLR